MNGLKTHMHSVNFESAFSLITVRLVEKFY